MSYKVFFILISVLISCSKVEFEYLGNIPRFIKKNYIQIKDIQGSLAFEKPKEAGLGVYSLLVQYEYSHPLHVKYFVYKKYSTHRLKNFILEKTDNHYPTPIHESSEVDGNFKINKLDSNSSYIIEAQARTETILKEEITTPYDVIVDENIILTKDTSYSDINNFILTEKGRIITKGFDLTIESKNSSLNGIIEVFDKKDAILIKTENLEGNVLFQIHSETVSEKALCDNLDLCDQVCFNIPFIEDKKQTISIQATNTKEFDFKIETKEGEIPLENSVETWNLCPSLQKRDKICLNAKCF